MSLPQDLEQLKKELKEKWLEHFKLNQDWIIIWVTKNGLWRPTQEKVEDEILESLSSESQKYSPRTLQSDFLIGFISGLEPALYSLLKLLCITSPNSENIINALELNFDPLVELERRKYTIEDSKVFQEFPVSELDDIREQIKLQNGEIT
ncbi:MAG: DUF5331 domain-containing protein [Limnothrix sp. RL_2_0]|nr:DUF5331 domain-containing protein [Limnothrix sp. RL_2_0]